MAFTVTTMFLATTAHADYYSSNQLLMAGSRGNEVVNLQNDLKNLGYFQSNSTGYYGPITKQAVVHYQRDKSLMIDGIVGHQTSRQIKVDKVMYTAKRYIDVPYKWGGTDPSGFDCSGFTHYVMIHQGIVIPRTAELQYQTGTWVSRDGLKPGDLVFFTTYKPGPSHVGIYLGNNQFINAGSSGVYITSLSNPYYAPRYIGARRVIR
jgi:cell wall-associated NlpC family hydrolase